MCGIAGAVSEDPALAQRVVAAINIDQEHRGPDTTTLVRAGQMTLGNTRLAIQDLSERGNQPFRSPDGRYVVVFNGEIYNHRTLVADHCLKIPSSCDGAVIPALWSRYGPACLELFEGMYAVAIADTQEDTLTLARDPFGIKPLYWRQVPGIGVVFASEIRPLRRFPPQSTVSASALSRFFHLGSVGGDEAPFDDIHAVPANSWMTWGDGPISQGSCVVDPVAVDERASQANPAALAQLFLHEIDQHMGADVPTGLLLSSGVDSSCIAAAASRLGRSLTCITVADSAETSEVSAAQATAAHYRHTHVAVKSNLEADDVATFFRAMQRPTIDGLNTFVVCRALQEYGLKVGISGLGGDEALSGYSHARLLPALRWLPLVRAASGPIQGALTIGAQVVPRLGSPKSRRLFAKDGPRDARGLSLLQRELFTRDRSSQLLGYPSEGMASRYWTSDDSGIDKGALGRSELDLYLKPMLLPDADAFSMCWSVELRIPFVTPQFIGMALALARSGGRGFGKRNLVQGLQDDFLSGVLKRRKQGFGLPMRHWMSGGPLRPHLDRLADGDAPIWSVVDRTVAEAVVSAPVGARWSEVWSFVALNGWLESL
jgi:asparagine synthase (glutamine-hydrolysing)